MFESAELGHKISKDEYAEEEPKLREKLLDVQYDLLEKSACSVVIASSSSLRLPGILPSLIN